jgi:hypothetical protein
VQRPDFAETEADGDVVILMPVLNDWNALGKLLVKLDAVLCEHNLPSRILIVDDDSTDSARQALSLRRWHAIKRIEVLRLRRNLGHQRAIAIGLAYVEDKMRAKVVAVMDSDGEDDPSYVPRLLSECAATGYQKIVFADRTKRSESQTFRVFYRTYKLLFRVLTGNRLRVGNFSVIPRTRLSSLVAVSELWNHYAAAVFKSRQPFCTVPSTRARRLDGGSRLSFSQLVIHGLSAIAVYSDVVGVRLLIASCFLVLLTTLGIATTIAIRIFTERAIPGWATYTTGLLLVILFQAIMLSVIFSFTSLGDRQRSAFLPIRDYANFVASIDNLEQCGAAENPSVPPSAAVPTS